jgi:angio-associated migratory cell protein
MMNLFGHADSCTSGSFSPDGKTLITASNDKTTRIWELKNQACKFVIRGHKYHKADILCLAIAKNKPLVATGSGYNELGVVNYESGSVSITVYNNILYNTNR